MTRSTETLASLFRALQDERARDWPPARLAANLAQRESLRAGFDAAAAPRPGDVLPQATFVGVDDAPVALDDLVAAGPAVLILFRYNGCPADEIAVPHYDAALAGAGVPVIAISPQPQALLAPLAARHGLGLTLASDPENRFAAALGLTFAPDERPTPPPAGWIGEVAGTGRWDLPLTGVLIVDRGRVLRWIAISPDWLDRVEGDAVRRALAGDAAASIAA